MPSGDSSQQAQKAKDPVQSGNVLTRAGISDLTKAEARAYLSAITGSSVNGNRSVLLAAIRAAFDEKSTGVVWPSYFTATVGRGAVAFLL